MSPSGGAEGAVAAALGRRAERAQALSGAHEAAREPLRFAAGLYRAQAVAAAALAAEHAARPFRGELGHDVQRLLEPARGVLRFAAECAPAPLAAEARARLAEDPARAGERLRAYWEGRAAPDYLSRALLRPWAEVLGQAGVRLERGGEPGPARCPRCRGGPWVASRREEPSTQGAARYLHCAQCGGEWGVSRILCPACGETDPKKLPSFQVEAYPEARIEACDGCHHYVKSIDLTLDARRLPEVDELASLALDLWAAEQGYRRIEPGLAGV